MTNSNHQAPTNPFTGEMVTSIREFDALISAAADLYLDDAVILVEDDEMRRKQLKYIGRGALVSTQTNTDQLKEVDQGREQEVQTHLFKFDDIEDPLYPDSRQMRLHEQGQATHADFNHSKRENFLRIHKNGWRPASGEETTYAISGLAKKLRPQASFAEIDRIIKKVESWTKDARMNLDALSIDDEIQSIHDKSDIPGLLRNNYNAVEALVKMRVNARVFLTGKTLQKGKKPRIDLEKETRKEIMSLSDDQLLDMWRTGIRASKAREAYWSGQLEEAKSHPKVAALRDDAQEMAGSIRY